MAERSSSWLETQPQSDGVERGPSWAALGQDKVTPAHRPALNRSRETHLQGLVAPGERQQPARAWQGTCHLLRGTPLKKWGVCWGLGHSVCWALPTGIGRSNSGSGSTGTGPPGLSPGVSVSPFAGESGFLIPSWLGLTHKYSSLSSVVCQTACSPFCKTQGSLPEMGKCPFCKELERRVTHLPACARPQPALPVAALLVGSNALPRTFSFPTGSSGLRGKAPGVLPLHSREN